MEHPLGKLGTGGAEEGSANALGPLSLTERLSAEIAGLKELDLEGLRKRWCKLFRAAAPPHLPKYLLFRVLAYRIQANALGDLDRESVRFLDALARESEQRRAQPGYRRSKAPPTVPPVPDRRGLKPGTILVREHAGVLKQLQLGAVGYAYQQLTCDSGAGNRVGCFQSRVFGLGPQIGYIVPMGEHLQGYLNLKGYKEFGAEHRPEGWNAWLTFAVSQAAKTATTSTTRPIFRK